MTRAQRTLRDFRAWISTLPRPAKSLAGRPPRNEHEKAQRELRQRLRTAYGYAPALGKTFATKSRPYQKMIVDPITGQWWNAHKYNAREARVAERLKARRTSAKVTIP